MSDLASYALTLFLSWVAFLTAITLTVAGLVWLAGRLGLTVPGDDDVLNDPADDWGQWTRELTGGER